MVYPLEGWVLADALAEAANPSQIYCLSTNLNCDRSEWDPSQIHLVCWVTHQKQVANFRGECLNQCDL